MKNWDNWKPRQLTEAQWFWFLLVIGALTRIPLLRFSTAETTDTILSLTYFSKDFVQTPRFCILPGYPFLLRVGQWLGWEGALWGRAIAALAGLLFLIPLWNYSKRWVTLEMSGMICLMAIFSPLLWQWSLKAMPDTLFLFLFWWCLERLTSAWIDKEPIAWVVGCLAGSAAACVRPEGFLLLPWVLAVGWRTLPQARFRAGLVLLALWAAPLLFLKEKFLTILVAYREGMGLTSGADQVQFPFLNFVDHFYVYLSQPVYVFTPLIFWFAVLGLSKMVRREDALGESFLKIILQVYLLIFLSRIIPTTYQDRHMMPFLPLLLVAAGYHLQTFLEHWHQNSSLVKKMFWQNGLLTIGLVYTAVFSAAVLICQYDSFGDIKRSAEFLKSLPQDAVIYSDEVPKTQYWSGRKVIPLELPFNPKPGDYLIMHSFYTTRLNYIDENLRARHGASLLHMDESMVVPLLTDVMADPGQQNRITSTAYRFEPQFFQSLIYKIGK
jgi:hypothetical protein